MSDNRRTIRLTTARAMVQYLSVQYSRRDEDERRLIPGMFGIFGHGTAAGMGDLTADSQRLKVFSDRETIRWQRANRRCRGCST